MAIPFNRQRAMALLYTGSGGTQASPTEDTWYTMETKTITASDFKKNVVIVFGGLIASNTAGFASGSGQLLMRIYDNTDSVALATSTWSFSTAGQAANSRIVSMSGNLYPLYNGQPTKKSHELQFQVQWNNTSNLSADSIGSTAYTIYTDK